FRSGGADGWARGAASGLRRGPDGRLGHAARRPGPDRDARLQGVSQLAGQQPAGAQATGQQQGDALALPPSGTPFNPSGEGEQQSLGRSLLRAMIAAAKADGRVEAAEQASIFAEMDKLDL